MAEAARVLAPKKASSEFQDLNDATRQAYNDPSCILLRTKYLSPPFVATVLE